MTFIPDVHFFVGLVSGISSLRHYVIALESGIVRPHGTVDSMDRDAIGPSLFAWFNTRVGDLTDERSMQCAS